MAIFFFALKSSHIRNLFNQSTPWMEASVAMFWGGLG
jgi:hypothetical protein